MCSICAVLAVFDVLGTFCSVVFSIEAAGYWSSLAMSVAVFVVFWPFWVFFCWLVRCFVGIDWYCSFCPIFVYLGHFCMFI